MAVYTETLKAIKDRRKAPYAWYNKTVTGVDEVKVYGGEHFGVPNVWGLAGARIQLTTDATVANRQVRLRQVGPASTMFEALADAVPASTAVTHLYFPLGYEAGTITAVVCGLGDDKSIVIQDTDYLWVVIDTGKAGDSVQVRFMFKWLNWELGMDLPWGVSV